MIMLTVTIYSQFNKAAPVMNLIQREHASAVSTAYWATFLPVVTQSIRVLGVSETSVGSTESFPRSEQTPVRPYSSNSKAMEASSSDSTDMTSVS